MNCAGVRKKQNILMEYNICPLLGKRDSPNRGTGCGIGKENRIRDRDERSSEGGILVKKLEAGMPGIRSLLQDPVRNIQRP